MKTKFWLVSFIPLCLVSYGLSWPQVQPTARHAQDEEIRRFIEKYDNAWSQKDIAAMDRVLAPDYVYFGSKGDVRTRQSLLEESMSPKYHLASADRTELSTYVTFRTAVVSSRWKGHGTFNGEEFHDDQRCSIALARGNADWLMVSEHCTQLFQSDILLAVDTRCGATSSATFRSQGTEFRWQA